MRASAIAGLGITEMGRVYGRTATQFAADAVRAAVDDAGLSLAEIDGLLISGRGVGGIDTTLANHLGLTELNLLSSLTAYGSTAGAMVMLAAMAIRAGTARAVACVFADAPLAEGVGAASSYTGLGPTGWGALAAASGVQGATAMYALAARRHMLHYGTTSADFGAIAVAQREWAVRNPYAQMRTPITIDDHQNSRWIVDPLHLLDCCLVSNGGVAVIVTSAEQARSLAQPPVDVAGWSQAHPGGFLTRDDRFGLVTGAAQSGPRALAMAGVGLADIDLVELYDCYTFTVLISLEDYGFCGKGEVGAFVSDGALAPGGRLAVNTGGGQLSSYYMWGMTPLSEAIIQLRGHGGARQVDRHEVALVSGNGGVLDHHSTLVLTAGRN